MTQELQSSLLASTKRDAHRFATIFLACTTIIASYHAVVARWADPRDYVKVVSTEGPWSATYGGHGGIVHGSDSGVYHPGESVGWTSTVCIDQGVPVVASVEMIRLAQDGLPAAQVSSRTTKIATDVVRCGPRDYALRVPDDAVPGTYEMRRVITSRTETVWPLRSVLPILQFRVVSRQTAP